MHLVGARENVLDIMKAGYVLAAPILQEETFGNVALEARSVGLPVVTFARGGLTELVGHGTTGYVCASADLAGLLDGLRYFLAHPAERAAASARSLAASVDRATKARWRVRAPRICEDRERSGTPIRRARFASYGIGRTLARDRRGLIAHNAFTAERYRRVVEGAALRDGDRVLDYGCGDGALLGALHRGAGRRHYDLHGFDPNTLAVELASAALPANGVQATIHGSLASLPAGHFDRVICTEVIEHASDPDALLRELTRVLKPGGRAVVSTPIRMTEHPEDVNHVREWFPSEFLPTQGGRGGSFA